MTPDMRPTKANIRFGNRLWLVDVYVTGLHDNNWYKSCTRKFKTYEEALACYKRYR